MLQHCDELKVSRTPNDQYGRLEGMIRGIRQHRPLDLNAERWREAHPKGSFKEWQAAVRQCLLDGLHLDPGPVDLQSGVLSREPRDGFILEAVLEVRRVF